MSDTLHGKSIEEITYPVKMHFIRKRDTRSAAPSIAKITCDPYRLDTVSQSSGDIALKIPPPQDGGISVIIDWATFTIGIEYRWKPYVSQIIHEVLGSHFGSSVIENLCSDMSI